jgi:L-fuconolactonase
MAACAPPLFWGNVDAGTALIDRHPDARFIIDHMGIQQPSVPPAPPQPWADLPKVVELAKRKNAVIKITGACTLSKEPYPFPDIWDPLARIFDAWGSSAACGARTGRARLRSSTTSRPSSPS